MLSAAPLLLAGVLGLPLLSRALNALTLGGRVTALGTPEGVLTPAIIEEAFGHRVAVTPHPCLKCPLIVGAQ